MTRPVPKSYGANGGKPNKWRRRRLSFSFRLCSVCKGANPRGGARRHVAVAADDRGVVYACSMGHTHVVEWTKDEKRNRDVVAVLKHVYMPSILADLTVSASLRMLTR